MEAWFSSLCVRKVIHLINGDQLQHQAGIFQRQEHMQSISGSSGKGGNSY